MDRMDMGSGSSSTMDGDMSMDHGDDGGSMMMSMADMTMTFFDSIHTPLFSEAWAPKTTGQYAGTCIFLIALAVVLRVMLAFRPILEASVWRDSGNAHGPLHQSQHHGVGGHAHHEATDKPEYRPQSQYGWIAFRTEISRRWLGWRASSSAGRACYELVLAGLAYLL
jgi:hypothetical protein